MLEHASRNPKVRYLGLLKREDLARWAARSEDGPLPDRAGLRPRGQGGLSPQAPRDDVVRTACHRHLAAGQAEIVSGAKAGILVPPGDVEALIAAVATLHASPDRERMGVAAVEAMRERQAQQDGAARMERIIADAASGSVGR